MITRNDVVCYPLIGCHDRFQLLIRLSGERRLGIQFIQPQTIFARILHSRLTDFENRDDALLGEGDLLPS